MMEARALPAENEAMGIVMIVFLLFAVLVGLLVLVVTALSSRAVERAEDGTVLRGSSRTRRGA
jgi:hypothetical protein